MTRSTSISFITCLGCANDIIWGAGARISPSRFFQKVPTVDFSPAEDTYSIYSGFAQDSLSLLSNRLTATLGAKLEHNSYSDFEIQPSARLAWTPNEQHTVWAAITRAVRTPSRLEEGFHYTALAVPSLPLYLRLVGDGQFDSERQVGYELGYRTYVKDRGFIGINSFYNRYTNLLSVENRPPTPEATPAPLHLVLPLFLRNGITARTKGFEISSLWDVKSWWRLKPSYSYLHLDADRAPGSNDASTVAQLEGDTPSHKVVVQMFFSFCPRLSTLISSYRYVSAIPDQKVASYSTGDVRIARRMFPQPRLIVGGTKSHAAPSSGVRRIARAQLWKSGASAYLKLTWTQ